MNLHPAIIFLGGLVIIILGAEMLLRGASRLAAMLGVKPIVIGLTVVAVGTSAPELAVGLTAAFENRGALAVGNIAGANILNILLTLGLSALIRPLPMRLMSIRLDVPVMLAASLALIVMAWDGVLSHTDGILLLLGAVVYTVTMVRMSRRETAGMKREFSEEYSAASLGTARNLAQGGWNALLLISGMALTVLGAELMVSSAINIAQAYGISDAIIGLTIVAMGTSAPELATTLVATYKDDRDVAVGNLIGSCIYNILVILGATSLAAPNGVAVGRETVWIDLPLAAAVALVCLPVFRSDSLVSRREGGAFVAAYLAYLAWLGFGRI